jgi:hypothetical protein
MSTRNFEMVGPRLETVYCAHGRRGMVHWKLPDAVVSLEIQPDGSDWCTVFLGGEECTPTGQTSICLDVEQAKRLIGVLQAAVSERELAIKHGSADY